MNSLDFEICGGFVMGEPFIWRHLFSLDLGKHYNVISEVIFGLN